MFLTEAGFTLYMVLQIGRYEIILKDVQWFETRQKCFLAKMIEESKPYHYGIPFTCLRNDMDFFEKGVNGKEKI
jgi:hypothetical protein